MTGSIKTEGPQPIASRWYVVQTKPRSEALARDHLLRQGFEAYLPGFARAGQRWQAVFPRYLFVRPSHAAQSIAPIRSTSGVSQLVRFGATPASIGDAVLQDIEALVQELAGVPVSVAQGMVPGATVRFKAGGLQGLEGLVKANSQERVLILMQLLGREVEVQVQASLLELAR